MSALDELKKKKTPPTELELCILMSGSLEDPEKAASELSALRAEVERLKDAIKPFAEIPCLENFDDDQFFDPAGGVLAGNVRKARAALNAPSEGQKRE